MLLKIRKEVHMKFLICVICATLFSAAFATSNSVVDCSEAYGGAKSKCLVVPCDAKYSSFIGTWSGPFSSYVKELSTEKVAVSRPFQNEVTYSENDCLKNIENDDSFIIGRRIDVYPSFANLPTKTVKGLLITGKKANGLPFLRTAEGNAINDYTLVYQNKPANMSIWSLKVPAQENSPEMRFTTIDGQDFTETSAHRRNVTVTMSVGPNDRPYWEGVIASGYHSKSK